MRKLSILMSVLLLLGLLGLYVSTRYFLPDFFGPVEEPAVPQELDEERELYGEWEWSSSVDGSGIQTIPKDSSKFILTLTPEGRLTTDCNVVSGSFVTNGEVMSIGSLNMTEIACEEETLELTYITQLANISSYTIQNNRLTLNLVRDFGTMIFSKK
jgi:heat shock protein HslJ